MQSLDEYHLRPGHGERLKTSDNLQDYTQRRDRKELENYVDVHRNNSDPDLGVELETQLSVPQATGFHDKREMSCSGSVDDLDNMNEGEKVDIVQH